MKKETIKAKVLRHLSDAVFDRDDGERLWFKVYICTQWSFKQMRLPYWQVVANDYKSFYLVVFYKK